MNKNKNKYNLRVGDMIIYNYLETDKLKGRVLELKKDKVKIEIGISHRKSEDVYIDNIIANYEDVIPIAIDKALKK